MMKHYIAIAQNDDSTYNLRTSSPDTFDQPSFVFLGVAQATIVRKLFDQLILSGVKEDKAFELIKHGVSSTLDSLKNNVSPEDKS